MTLIERLRALANWFEAHPEAPQHYLSTSGASACTYVNSVDDFKHLGPFTKEMDKQHFFACVTVGDVKLRFMASRNDVCIPKVVGKKQVPEVVIPATPERVIPAHEEDIVEWDCRSVLAPEDETQEVGS